MSMKVHIAILCVALAGAGCKKSTGTGGGGGGGGWFTTGTGMIVHVDPTGTAEAPLDVAEGESLNGIACRYQGEAWVVGDHGTLLYTSDGGHAWTSRAVPTQADLYTLATQDAGPVFIAGDGVVLRSQDAGASWQQLGDGLTRFLSLSAAERGSTVLAVAEDGGLWAYDAAAGALTRHTVIEGARAVAISPEGDTAIVAGRGLWQSLDSGNTWTQLFADPALALEDVRIHDDGGATAVGAAGTIATVDPSGVVSIQHAGSADLTTLHVPDADAVDGVGYAGSVDGSVWITHDLGLTWSPGPFLPGAVLGVDEIGFGHR
jgi:photosystem II stability/assembly factor-like uncharacterized protein